MNKVVSIIKKIIKMKKLISLFAFFLSITTAIFAQNYSSSSGWGGEKVRGEGESIDENRTVGNFTGVSTGTSADVIVTQGSTFKVRITGQKNIIALFETRVENNILKIYVKKGYNLNYNVPVRVYVEAPNFEILSTSGSGDFKSTNALSGKKLSISTSGSGDFDLKGANFSDVSILSSGSGDVNLGGKVQKLNIRTSGSGDINAQDLKSTDAECLTSGSGNISCAAEGALNVMASGSGNVTYIGKPASLKTRKTGSGNIKSR